jgi:hypothetical protein
MSDAGYFLQHSVMNKKLFFELYGYPLPIGWYLMRSIPDKHGSFKRYVQLTFRVRTRYVQFTVYGFLIDQFLIVRIKANEAVSAFRLRFNNPKTFAGSQ